MFKTDFSSDNHRLYELYEMYLFYQVYIHLSLFVFVEIEIGRRKFHKKNLHKQCHYLMVATCLFPVHVCLDSIIQAFMFLTMRYSKIEILEKRKLFLIGSINRVGEKIAMFLKLYFYLSFLF